jgi:hypothetical protein
VVGTGSLEKLLEVISRLPRLAFEVMLGGGDELLVRIVGLLVVVSLITIGSDCDPLGSLVGPPLVAFGVHPCPLEAALSGAPRLPRGPSSRSPG